MIMKKKILITGSLGFIGSNLIRFINYLKLPYELCGIDNAYDISLLNNIYVNKNQPFHLVDINDERILERIFKLENPEIVIHLAGLTNIDNSDENDKEYLKNNINGTKTLLDACKKNNIAKFIYISTDNVYKVIDNLTDNAKEDFEIQPDNYYAFTVSEAEKLIKSSELNFNIIRACNIIGPRASKASFFPKIIKSILNKDKIEIYGKGNEMRSWMYSDSLCLAILKVIESGVYNEIYNCSSGFEMSNIELVNKVCNIMGGDLNSIVFNPRKRSANNGFRYSMNYDKIKNLGWTNKLSFNDTCEKTVKWYVNNSFYLK